MDSLTIGMQDHHRHCDDAFALAEESAQRGDWPACSDAFDKFKASLEAHFDTEEGVIFPAFEQRSGMFGGPTQVMRMEHIQMRGLLGQMAQACEGRDKAAFGGAAETLLVMMQQHNLKEENILYPMCEQVLGDDAALLGEVERSLAPAA